MKIFSYLMFFIFNFIFPADVGLACCSTGSRDDIKILGYVGYKGFSFCPETRQFSVEFWDDVDSMKMKLEKSLNLYCLITTMELNRARQVPFSAKAIARNEESPQSLVLSFVASEKGRSEEVSQSSVSRGDQALLYNVEALEARQRTYDSILTHVEKIDCVLSVLFCLISVNPDFVVVDPARHKEPALAPNFNTLVNRIGRDLLHGINIDSFKSEFFYLMKFLSLSAAHLARIGVGNESFMNLAEKLHTESIVDFYHKLVLEIEKFQSEIRQNKDKQAKPTRCVIL